MRPNVDLTVYECAGITGLKHRWRFADNSRETLDQVIDLSERLAREKFAPFNRLVDIEEPRFDGEKVILPQATHDATRAYAESGFLSAAQDYASGGMPLPFVVELAAKGFVSKASVSIGRGVPTRGTTH